MKNIRLIRTLSGSNGNYLVQEKVFSLDGKDGTWLEYARVSVTEGMGGFLVVEEYPWKEYVRMGCLSDDLKSRKFNVKEDMHEAHELAYTKVKEIGEKLARGRNEEVEDIILLPRR
ncbi:MAG: hypothetical protein AABX11_04230 [Nanoarchaeota archaeon]